MQDDKRNRRNRSPRKDRSFSKPKAAIKKFDVYILPPSRCNAYTPLNAPIEQIMHAIGNEKFVRKPYLLKGVRTSADRSKRCDYHHDYGHTT